MNILKDYIIRMKIKLKIEEKPLILLPDIWIVLETKLLLNFH